ncbi:MAG: tetratricopeptide repeat protein [Lentisphaeria bacterium]|nr:tetratricopeptide repeat protein [Lentisphaeria bacterium]
MNFTFFCKHCGQKIEADEKWIGRDGECPSCGKAIVILSCIDDPHAELKEHIRKYPGLSNYQRTRVCLKQKKYSAAADLMNSPDLSPEQRFELEIQYYFEHQNWETARDRARVFIKTYPQSPVGYRWLAEIIDDGFHEREESLSLSTKAIEFDPNYTEAYIVRGNTKRWLDEPDFIGARRDYRAALKIDPENMLAYSGLGWVYLEEDNEKALRYFKECITRDTFHLSYGALQGAAMVAWRVGEFAQAIKWLDSAIEIAPEWYLYQTKACVLHEFRGAPDRQKSIADAFRNICKAVAVYPEDAELRDNLPSLAYKILRTLRQDEDIDS